MDLRGQTERAILVGATETSRYRKYIYVSIWLSASDFDEYRWHRRSVVFVSCPISVLLLDEIFLCNLLTVLFLFIKSRSGKAHLTIHEQFQITYYTIIYERGETFDTTNT